MGWVGVSSMILQHQMAQRHGAKVKNCISLYLLILVALLYVDDGEILEAAHIAKEFQQRVAYWLQASVNSYVGGLEVTGGGCKPSKCHW